MKYIIPGDPIALARVRFGRGRCWDSQKELKVYWQIHLHNQHVRRPFYRGPLHAEINFYMPMPSRAKKHQQAMYWHASTPDLSNLIKFIEDVGIGILYHDDCIISSICAQKLYDKDERTELIITELDK
jgi:Holliday junction resolvase RusA-like endonuclease